MPLFSNDVNNKNRKRKNTLVKQTIISQTMVSNWPHQTDANRYITACNTNRKEDVSIPYFHSKDYKKISVGLSLYLYENCLKTNINKLDFGRRVGEGAWRRERGKCQRGTHMEKQINEAQLTSSRWKLLPERWLKSPDQCWMPAEPASIDKWYSVGHHSLSKLWSTGHKL